MDLPTLARLTLELLRDLEWEGNPCTGAPYHHCPACGHESPDELDYGDNYRLCPRCSHIDEHAENCGLAFLIRECETLLSQPANCPVEDA